MSSLAYSTKLNTCDNITHFPSINWTFVSFRISLSMFRLYLYTIYWVNDTMFHDTSSRPSHHVRLYRGTRRQSFVIISVVRHIRNWLSKYPNLCMWYQSVKLWNHSCWTRQIVACIVFVSSCLHCMLSPTQCQAAQQYRQKGGVNVTSRSRPFRTAIICVKGVAAFVKIPWSFLLKYKERFLDKKNRQLK